MLITKIVTARWTEPEEGEMAEVWSLPKEVWKEIEAVLAWLDKEQGDNVGHTFALFQLHDTSVTGGDKTDVQEVMEFLAENIRYTNGDGELFGEDCPVLAKYGIERC